MASNLLICLALKFVQVFMGFEYFATNIISTAQVSVRIIVFAWISAFYGLYHHGNLLHETRRKYEFVWGVDSKNYSEEVVKSYICLHGSIVQERRRNHQLSIVNLGAIYAGGSSNNNRANNLLFGRELAQLIFSGATANDTYQACDPNCQPRQCCVDEKCLCIDSITTVATVLECKDCNLTCKNEGTMLSNCSGCLCIPGYEGITCDINTDDCVPNPCQNGETCVDGINSYTCNCVDGYNGTNCGNNIDDCSPNPCQNGGTCTDGIESYICNCVDGYNGTNCENNINECFPNKCQNGGICFDDINSYTCTCIDGYNGTNCENDINDCIPNPCQNEGTCIDGINSYTCSCVMGYNGTNCEKDINDCIPNPCQNGGTCIDKINSYTCICIDGYNGTNCEKDINDCIPNPCQNGGTCIDKINSYTCICIDGYNGTDCEKNINDCIPNLCQNGGTCIDGINSYTCSCVMGYNGTNCEVKVDECIPNPCNNKGICTNLINDYNCTCHSIYFGRNCSVFVPVITISPADSIQGGMVGSPQYINCAVDTVNEVQLMIIWGGPNGNNIINDNRVKITQTTASDTTYTSSLQFTYLMEGDEGTYTCNVIISEISWSQSIVLSSLIIPTPTVNVVVTSPQKVGQSLTLYCNGTTVRGITSSVYIVWRRGNTIVNTTHVTATTMLGNLLVYRDSYTIMQLSISDDGVVYECTLVIQTSLEVRAHDTVRLDVNALPRIHVHPLDKIIEINNDSTSVTFICMAYEAISYFWLRKMGDIPSNATGVKSNKLTLHNVLPPDGGQYQCVAENEHGKTYSNYAMCTVKALPPMVIIESETEVKVRKGESVEFICSATGVGSVYFIYQWFLNGLPITNQDTSTLVINAVSENDTGDYKCFVRNQYNGTGQSEVAKLILDQFCNPVTVNYTGFSVTWNKTQAGITVEILCTGHGLSGTVRRRCIRDHLWEEIFDCFRQETNMLLHQAINLTLSKNKSNETETIAITSNIANALVNVTTPTQEPIFAQDINLAVNTLSVLNSVTETFIANLTVNDTFFEDATSVINNLLSDTNQESWNQLKRSSPSTSQDLVSSAEQITKLLSETLTNNATESIKTRPNIIIKAERLTNDGVHEGYMFPDEDDNLTAYNGGNARLMVSSDVLQSISFQELTIASTVIRNGTGLRLPSSNNRLGDPISPIFSLQINPLPESQILVKNPIMLMFDVDRNATILDQNIVQDEQDFTVYDVSCNFYDNTLVTNDNLNQIGGWSTDGLTVDGSHSNETLVTCLTTHLTSFAVLVSIQDERPPSTADKALSIISYIGCSISLVFLCISIIFLSYTIYKTKDKKNHLFIHLNLCIALSLGLVVFISGIENAIRWEESCKFVAALLQYLFISAFCWMLCEGVMLYMMLVTVFGNKLNKRRFFFVLGWGPALLIVGISAGIAHKHYGTDYYCWIKSNDGAIAAFIAPIGAIMMINCIFFAITLKVLCQQKTMSKQVSSNKDTVKNILKAAVLLLPLLGMTWIVGIFAVNNETQLFAWIFAILNSLQGVFIFLLHVIRNKQVVKEIREHYNFMRRSEMFNRLHSGRGSGNTSTSGISSKAKSFQNTSSKVSGHDKNISTTSSGFSSKNLAIEMSLKDEAFEDSEGGHLKSTTFKKLEGSIIEEHDVGMVSRDPTEEERKSITEEDGEAIVYSRKE